MAGMTTVPTYGTPEWGTAVIAELNGCVTKTTELTDAQKLINEELKNCAQRAEIIDLQKQIDEMNQLVKICQENAKSLEVEVNAKYASAVKAAEDAEEAAKTETKNQNTLKDELYLKFKELHDKVM